MLERIERIQGIGLLHDVHGRSHQFQKATLIYADNGRGKSTLAAVLRSAASGAAAPISERKTLDGVFDPCVMLNFSNGVKVEYVGGKWARACPEILIFDGNFIEENVCSGGAVGPGHRKNLLQFALGTAAVDARKKEEQATFEASKAGEAVRQFTGQLGGYHGPMSLVAFEKLTMVEDADARIAELQKRLVIANSAAEVLKRPVPREIGLPPFDAGALFGILRASLEDIQDDAELLVRNHIASYPGQDIEGWISSGQHFNDGERCPYCAQDTTDLGLIRAYRTHFNAAYARLKTQVGQLRRGLEIRLGPQIVATFIEQLATAAAQRVSWAHDTELIPFEFDLAGAEHILATLNELLSKLVEAKELNPTTSISTPDDIRQVEALWGELMVLMVKTNEQIRQCASTIEVFKRGLAQEQPASVQAQINTLIASKRRFEPAVIELFTRLGDSKKAEAGRNVEKKKAREDLDAVMTKTLGAYEKAINGLLLKFGATFNIEKMDANFRGGSPRTEYGIKMRGKSVQLEGGTPRFATALSDGDKRTLAFAFFVASSAADPAIQSRIIVVDDPMCSLDANRKHHTKAVLQSLHAKATQLIVLAHDPFFVRDLRDELLPKDGQAQVQVLQLCHAENGYSTISKFDVDQACESKYYRHHRMLKEFCAGTLNDERSVAMALRPFLEGYLHRRFPRLVPSGIMFGQAIGFIKKAEAPSPVTFAHSLVDELDELNNYAGQFHHDTNQGNADAVQVVTQELRTYCERALHLSYSGQIKT